MSKEKENISLRLAELTGYICGQNEDGYMPEWVAIRLIEIREELEKLEAKKDFQEDRKDFNPGKQDE